MDPESPIDLHTHTTASDGTYTPTELVAAAKELGLAAVAVTDHDTLEGVPEAIEAGARYGVEVVPAVEISSEFAGKQMDILCYFIDGECAEMVELIEWVQNSRRNRNPEIARRIAGEGIPLELADVAKYAEGGQVGRPHFAQALIELGVVETVQEAFDKFLAPGGPAYVPKARLEPETVISTVRTSGGVAVLAHPCQIGTGDHSALRDIVVSLTELGLMGIEVYYPSHTPAQTAQYKILADEFDLAITGGSDFHGARKPAIHLGKAGERPIPYRLLSELRARMPDVAS